MFGNLSALSTYASDIIPFISATIWSTCIRTVLSCHLLPFRNCRYTALESILITSHALLKQIPVEGSALFDKHQSLGIFMILILSKINDLSY